jgi:hypothetical protein
MNTVLECLMGKREKVDIKFAPISTDNGATLKQMNNDKNKSIITYNNDSKLCKF